MFQTKFVAKIKRNFSCSITFLWKLCRSWDNVEMYVRVRQTTNNVCPFMLDK